MRERFDAAFDEVYAANLAGEVKNILITDGDAAFLEDAADALRSWARKNAMELVELDERDDSWLPEIQSRELFYKLNRPNTVLVIRNYATVTYPRGEENTPRNFLRDAILNRHYACGNDFVPSDDLPNLAFVAVINDLTEMGWRRDEYMTFSVMHLDDGRGLWINKNTAIANHKMHKVMSAVNQVKWWVSEDKTTLYLNAVNAFVDDRTDCLIRSRLLTGEEKSALIYEYIEKNLPYFYKSVNCLILKLNHFRANEPIAVDGTRLKQSFPNLGTIYSKDDFEIVGTDHGLYVLDPFDLGEMAFYLAQEGDVSMANTFAQELWVLDHKWFKFFHEVAKDYYRRTKDHLMPNPSGTIHHWWGMDHLFHVYLLGWYHAGDDFFDEADKVYIRAHKDLAKAIDLLAIRFKNCSMDEVAEKLYWDYRHVTSDENPNYEEFTKVLHEAERLVPGVVTKMYDEGVIPRFE